MVTLDPAAIGHQKPSGYRTGTWLDWSLLNSGGAAKWMDERQWSLHRGVDGNGISSHEHVANRRHFDDVTPCTHTHTHTLTHLHIHMQAIFMQAVCILIISCCVQAIL